ncbi:MAG: DUF433 domain-containing protein [Planctomycetaceae bacterium]|nr:DUF433 domain-containing protein [Planctomycetaceae bacterium]
MSQVVATHIELRNNRSGQPRAYIIGTRIQVQDVSCLAEREGATPDEIVAAFPHLTLGQVHAALAYYFDHRDAILQELREDEALDRELRASLPPGQFEQRLKGKITDHAIPS